MSDSPLHRLRHRAQALGERALRDFLTDDRRAEALGKAAQSVQRGRQILDDKSTKILAKLGLATQADLEKVSRKVGRLRKQVQALVDQLGERHDSSAPPPSS